MQYRPVRLPGISEGLCERGRVRNLLKAAEGDFCNPLS